MDVVLVRHGTAEGAAHRDRERALTLEGRREAREIGGRLGREGFVPELVIASPFVRAVQTAELAAAALGYLGPVRVSRALRPESPPDGVVDLLSGLDQALRVMLVAHEPVLSATWAALVGQGARDGQPGYENAGHENDDHGPVGLRRAEAVRLTWQPPVPGTARVTWRGRGP